MSSTGQLIGLSGLNVSIDRRQQRQDQMLALEKMTALKQYNQGQEEKYLAKEQEINNAIRTEVEKATAGDQIFLNEKIKVLQQELKDKISKAGSRKAFFNNGGMKDLYSYQNSVLNSPELAQGKVNKMNASRIIELQLKGFGSLIAQQDALSYQEHLKDPSVKITFSGMLSKIEIPSKQYASGAAIPLKDIIEKNKMNLISNFKIENPDIELPTNQEKLNSLLTVYATEKGYSGIGSNDKIMANILRAREVQKKRDETRTVVGDITRFNNYSSGLTITPTNIDEILSNQTYSTLQTNAFGTGSGPNIGVAPTTIAGWLGNVVIDSVTTPFNFLTGGELSKKYTNARYSIKGGRKFVLQGKSAEKYLDLTDNEKTDKGYYKNVDLSSMNSLVYDVSGTEVSNADVGNFRIKGSVLGYGSKIGSGDNEQNMIYMEAVDKNGNPVDTTNELYGDNANDMQLKPKAYMVLENDDNETYYIEIPMTSGQEKNKIGEALGDINDLKEIVQSDTATEEDYQKNKKAVENYTSKQEEVKTEYKKKLVQLSSQLGVVRKSDDELFKSDEYANLWNTQVNSYTNAKGENREDFMRAFYSTFNKEEKMKGIDNNTFTKKMKLHSMTESLNNFKLSDKDLIHVYISKLKNAYPELKSELEKKELFMKAYLNYSS